MKFINIQRGEWLLFFTFALIAIADAITIEISYVLSVSGFVSQVGIEQIPVMWLVDMVIILGMSGLYSLIVDRVPRLNLVLGLLLIMIGANVAFRFALVSGAPDWLTYAGLFLWTEQQYVIFPLAFWALANDTYSVAQSKRLFPLIIALGLIGRVVGSGYAGASAKIFAGYGLPASELLLTNVFVLLLTFIVLLWASRHFKVHRARQDKGKFNMREMLSTGWDFMTNVKAFKFLTIAMVCVGCLLAVIEFHFLRTSDAAFTEPGSFQAFYGYYRMGLTITTLIIQSMLTHKLLNWIGLKSMFTILPLTLLTGLCWMLLMPGIIGGAVGRFLARLVFDSVDRPSRQTLQGLIPEERRGRVSTFMGSYLYVMGNICGSTVLLLIILAVNQNWLETAMSSIIYLLFGLVVAGISVYATWMMRKVYDESMLDWRLARRRRHGATELMKKLDL
ncbi:MAG: hypothetical protein KDJ52_25720 [Anaerolineae bacterium]|nr:hypothetical protein [Anaerolineae bacterium]